MTKCVECGGPVKTRREKQYRYTECGLSNVIVDGIEIMASIFAPSLFAPVNAYMASRVAG